MHPGHIKHFEEAKTYGDILIVTVTSDRFAKKGMGRPIFREQLRAQSIAALECVDHVAVDFHASSAEAIRAIQPDVFAKGCDYEGKETEEGHPTHAEKELVEQHGGRMQFTHDPVTFSSTALINDHFSALSRSSQEFLKSVRAQFSEADIARAFESIRNVRVLVIGDAILDVYHYSDFLGRSVKEEVPRVKIIGSEMFLGGSLAVANTLAGCCDTVGVAAVLGRRDPSKEEQNAAFIRTHLKTNVRPHFLYRDDAPTVVNERFVNSEPYLVERTAKVNMRKYFGLYHINETPVPADAETEWVLRLNEIASGYDAIIVTDYGLGMMTKRLIGAVTHLPLFLAVNTQTNSMNYGFNLITKYPRADYVSISLPEARLAFHDKASGAEDLIKRIAKTVSAESVAITLGSRGVLFLDADGRTQIPALSTSVVDNIGAGDAFLALSSLGVHLRFPRLLTGFLGATASALSCRIVANKETVDRTMLLETIRSLLKSHENGAALRASETAALRKRGTRQFCSTPA